MAFREGPGQTALSGTVRLESALLSGLILEILKHLL